MLSDLNSKRAGGIPIGYTSSSSKSSVKAYIKGAPIFEKEMEEPSDIPTKSIEVSRRLQPLVSSDSPRGGKRGETLSLPESKEEENNGSTFQQNSLDLPPKCATSTDSEWPWG